MSLTVVRTIAEVRSASRAATKAGKTVALVPTMGGLHKGHLSLVEKAGEIADLVIVSLFVNPTQFNNPEDLETYPGNEADDLLALSPSKADIVFAPSAAEMYPSGFSTEIKIDAAGNILCDAYRPGHFSGVATVVAKLFLQTEPDFACFGEKDFQQLFIIKRLVTDLNLPVEIIPVETVREHDGLALSSRNARLEPSDRKIAHRMNESMQKIAKLIADGERASIASEKQIRALENSGDFKVEYLEYRSGQTLEIIDQYEPDGRLFAAAWLGGVRLIDNIAV